MTYEFDLVLTILIAVLTILIPYHLIFTFSEEIEKCSNLALEESDENIYFAYF